MDFWGLTMIKNISLTSAGYKILTTLLSIFMVSLSALMIIFHEQIPWYVICFIIVVALFCLFGMFVCYYNRIVINVDEGYLSIYTLKHKRICIKDIKSVAIDKNHSINPKKYCFIIIQLKNGEIFKIPEYATLLKNRAVKITEEKIDILNQYLCKF